MGGETVFEARRTAYHAVVPSKVGHGEVGIHRFMRGQTKVLHRWITRGTRPDPPLSKLFDFSPAEMNCRQR